MTNLADWTRRQLALWGHPAPEQLEALSGAGGFSGAEFWRFESRERRWCLRRWPSTHPGYEQLVWIHRVLKFVDEAGLDCLPLPQTDASGETIARDPAGRLWELTPWMPGRAAESRETTDSLWRQRVGSAAQTVARFHRGAAQFPPPILRPGPSPGLQHRAKLLESFPRELEQVRQALAAAPDSPLKTLGLRWLASAPEFAAAWSPRIAAWSRRTLPLQICLRDVWSEHVLFADASAEVTGLVDFGAMRVDWVATDLARLLASYAEDDGEVWSLGLDAYQRIRPLDDAERGAVEIFDRSALVLSGLNWLRWIFCEKRRFDAMEVVTRRFERLLARLEHAVRA